MIKYLLLALLLTTTCFAQDIELSHNSSSTGPHFTEATYKAKISSLSVGAQFRSEPLGRYYKISANNDFDLDGTRCFYFGSGVIDKVNNEEYSDIGAGLYIINGEVLNCSVAGLVRRTEYLTSIRSRLSLHGANTTLHNVITYFPEVRLIENNLSVSYKLSEVSSLGYKMNVVGDRATDKLYLKFNF